MKPGCLRCLVGVGSGLDRVHGLMLSEPEVAWRAFWRTPASGSRRSTPDCGRRRSPPRSLDTQVWITLTGTIGLEAASSPRRPRYAEAMLLDSRVGRLSIPGWLPTMLAGSRGASLLRWQVPAIVERLEVGDGKLTIRAR